MVWREETSVRKGGNKLKFVSPFSFLDGECEEQITDNKKQITGNRKCTRWEGGELYER